MTTLYPAGLDNFTNPIATDSLDSVTVPHATQHADANDAIEAIEATLGINPQGASADVAARLGTLAPIASPIFTGVVDVPTITFGYTTTATSATPLLLTNTSTYFQNFTGSTAQTVRLPDTSTLTTGFTFEFRNNSTASLTVQTFTSVAVITVVAGQSYTFVCVNTTVNTAAAWDADWTGTTTVTGTGNNVLSASPTFTGQVTVPAGTTSAAPIIFQSGSLLTTAAGGRMEYDGRVHYLTPSSTAVGGRAVVGAAHYYALSADRNLTDVATAQSIFGVGVTLQATTTYEFQMLFTVSTTGANSNSLGIGFGGTATLTSIGYQVEASQNATSLATLSSSQESYFSTAANSTVTAAVATATYRVVKVEGLVRINATGTFIPQLTYSAAPGAIPVVAANSWIRLRPIGINTVTTVGAWA